jgi:N-acetylmuramoyl-L-alanine amidase
VHGKNWTDEQRQPVVEIEHVTEPFPVAPPPKNSEPLSGQHTNAAYAETWIPLNRWSRETKTGIVRRLSIAPIPSFAFLTTNGVFLLQANTLAAKFDGLELRLGFAPQIIDGQLYIHDLDLRKNIEPLIRGLHVPNKTNRIIVIDAGHGGQNTGTKSVVDQVDEKEFTLDWARRVESLLAGKGWQVLLTRTNDSDISLAQRVAFAEEHQADLFISLHFNSAAPSQEQAGLETFCITPTGMTSTLTRGYEDNIALLSANNAFDAENLQYAMLLHRSLLRNTELVDRGVRRARFLSVLRGQNRPAVLIEGGYLSNPDEARRIADPAYRDKLAQAVVQALTELDPTSSKTRSNLTARANSSLDSGMVNSNAAAVGPSD